MEITEENLNDVLGNDLVQNAIAEQTKSIVNEQLKGLQNKNSELLGEVKKLKDFKRGVPEDLDLEEYERLKQEAKDAEQRKAEEKGEWEKLRGTLVETHNQEKATLQEERDAFKAAMEGNLIDSVVNRTLADAGASLPLMDHVVRRNLRVVQDEDTGKYGVAVVDDTGSPRISGPTGEPMTVAELVKEFSEKPEYAPAFPGTKASGSGAQGGSRAGRPARKVTEMSRAEKAEFISEHGLAEYNKRRRAGK